MRILFLSFYFEPDLCAGSFRNSSLFKILKDKLKKGVSIDIITTHPNRYDSYKVTAESEESIGDSITINRIKIPDHNSGLLGQIKSFKVFYKQAISIAKRKGDYDLVYASSSRLFTAFLGANISRKYNSKLYLDIRDIFRESILDILPNSFVKLGLNLFLIPIEKYTFSKADHINLVSEGFKSYFLKYKNCKYSYFTNGIDDVFLKNRKGLGSNKNGKKTIVYGGNIGEGQGLHLILPKVANALKDSYEFKVFGDGGAKKKLIEAIETYKVSNISIYNPVHRNELIEEYRKADFLFLHLNKHKAFERVLPSKLFEYGVYDKPIIAGVEGFAKDFLNKELDNVIVFSPGDYNRLIEQLKCYEYKNFFRDDFVNKFSRTRINQLMSDSILKVLE